MKNLGYLALFLLPSAAHATPSIEKMFLNKYPTAENTALHSCATCHMPAKEGFGNPYSMALKAAKLNFEAVEGIDSDGDGKTNIEEISARTNPGSQAAEPEVFIFTSKLAPVRFDHGAHVVQAEYKINGSCVSCHDKAVATHFEEFFDDSVPVKDLAHNVCISCHKASGSPQAPAPPNCAGCHKRAN